MIWSVDGVARKSPGTCTIEIEDTDNNSYSSCVDGSLIDNPIAVGLVKISMSWDYLTEAEAEELCQLTYRNPLIATVKDCSISGGLLENAKFRVSKRKAEIISASQDTDTSKTKYKVSFSLMQKELTDGQKETVNNS